MTCIVGFSNGKVVKIAGDSAGFNPNRITLRKDSKVWVNGDFAFGATSSFRIINILKYSFKPPQHRPSITVEEYMNTLFIDEVRKSLKEGGFLSSSNNVESGGCFLAGYSGRLFKIDSDFQVGESLMNFESVGSGSSYAYGSMFSQNINPPKSEDDIETFLINALKASTFYSPSVCAPFNTVSVSVNNMD